MVAAVTPSERDDTHIGESFAGQGAEAAHVTTALGRKGGPVEDAWLTALATPRQGHSAFLAVLRPGFPVKPLTLFVNKAGIASEEHARLTWGAAQAGVASGVLDAVAGGELSPAAADDHLLIVAVWVDPAAADEGLVFANNRRATREAIEAGHHRSPALEELMALRDSPANPHFGAPGG